MSELRERIASILGSLKSKPTPLLVEQVLDLHDTAVAHAIAEERIRCMGVLCEGCRAKAIYNTEDETHGKNYRVPCHAVKLRKEAGK